MELELLTESNLTQLTALVLELWPDAVFAEEYESYQKIVGAAQEFCCLVKEGDVYIAFIHATLRSDYVEGATASPVAYIEALYVKPGNQRQGIGSMLLNAAIDWGRQKGCRQMASDTETGNLQSIHFHLRSGFEEANSIVCFIREI